MEFLPIRLPQFSPNDDVGIIVDWAKSSGDFANKGEIICNVETTKSIFDVEALATGYLTTVVDSGTVTKVGELIAVITAEPVSIDDVNNWRRQTDTTQIEGTTRGKKVSWTIKAELLAKKHRINLDEVPSSGKKITEDDVINYLASLENEIQALGERGDYLDDLFPENRSQRLLVLGGGDGAIQILDVLAKTPDQHAIAILDDDKAKNGKKIGGIPIVGPMDLDWIANKFKEGEFDAAVISISTIIRLRANLYEALTELNIPLANVIHPSAEIGTNVLIGTGNVIMAFCHIGACSKIGNNNFLSVYCSIEHHNILGCHSSFGPGVITSSRVNIGDRVRFGTGIFIEPKLSIGSNSIIGSGIAIWNNIPENSVLKSKLGYIKRENNSEEYKKI